MATTTAKQLGALYDKITAEARAKILEAVARRNAYGDHLGHSYAEHNGRAFGLWSMWSTAAAAISPERWERDHEQLAALLDLDDIPETAQEQGNN